MRLNHVIGRSIQVGFLLVIAIIILIPSSSAYLEVDPADGVWTDDFENSSTVECENCVCTNGTITLDKSTNDRTYDFRDGGGFNKNSHAAYYYQTLFPPFFLQYFSFFSPTRHLIWEREFDETFEYPFIERALEFENRYASTSSTRFGKNVVHHFRFKLDVGADIIGNLEIYWSGKADDDIKTQLYYWGYTSELKIRAKWHPLTEVQSNSVYKTLYYNLSQDAAQLAVDDERYFDICLVASTSSSTTLYTDYVKIISQTIEGYDIGNGYAKTKEWIEPKDYISNLEDFYWDILTWDDYEKDGSTVSYQLLYNNSGNETLIGEKYLPGNNNGFYEPPVHLHLIDTSVIDTIKIRANLSTDISTVTPKVFRWTVTWQSDANKWQDLFNYSYRLDAKNKIRVDNGNVSIRPISGEWPMFGQNPSNTRYSEGRAAYTNAIYWWSNFHETREEEVRNPVISGESLYICTKDSVGKGHLYKYNQIFIPESQVGELYSSTNIDEFRKINVDEEKDIVSSPAVNDEYVIVATGETGVEGTSNYLYVLEKDQPGHEPVWIYEYENSDGATEDICYWGSPVVMDDTLYITSWSGDDYFTQANDNNKILALDLNDKSLIWEYTLPDWSFSTPAVYNNKVFVGCKEKNDNSFFAFDAETGAVLWNQSVGSIGKSSPVVSNDYVYVTSEVKKALGLAERIKITALDVTDGTIVWDKQIGRSVVSLPFMDNIYSLADSTPALYDGVLYVVSPDGWVSALDINNNGTELWAENVYTKFGPSSDILRSSPAYADGMLYVGTPDGYFYALDTTDNGTVQWRRQTYPYEQNIPVATSPIVSNGVVFYGAADGRLYTCGMYVEPDQEIDGNLVSIPIRLPEKNWWKKFYASYDTGEGNNILFSILDEENNLIKKVSHGENITLSNRTIERTIRLRADLSADNTSVKPYLLKWYVTFERDDVSPILNQSTFTPNQEGWINEIYPVFTIQTRDSQTGLLVSSVSATLSYAIDDEIETTPVDAFCSGTDGTTNEEEITVDISTLEFFDNITTLQSLTISIKDLADNQAISTVTFKQDMKKPTSSIETEEIEATYSTSPVKINAIASDPGDPDTNASGIDFVELYYKYSLDNATWTDWTVFESSSEPTSPSWNFTAVEGGGYYELITIATDNIGNVEDFPDTGEVSFILDPNAPNVPDYQGITGWVTERPEFTFEFSDDFRLDTIEYRPNFETAWIILASTINSQVYDDEWELNSDIWEQMQEGETYLLYFRLTDSLGNVYTTPDSKALELQLDISEPEVYIEILDLEAEWSWDDTFTIDASAYDGSGSGINKLRLYYRYSEDNTFDDIEWVQYGSTLTSSPYEWEFEADEGNGYYQFRIEAEDAAGNTAESEVFSTGINIFPVYLVVTMVVLLMVLILLTTVLFFKFIKK
jgi:outer membrane protein assembly factor BamB